MELHSITGNYHHSTPLLDASASTLICGCGSSIKKISAKTGELLATFLGHQYPVSCIAQDPRSASLVYSASIDGTILLWNIKTHAIKKQWCVNAPIFNLLVPHSKKEELYLVVGRSQVEENAASAAATADASASSSASSSSSNSSAETLALMRRSSGNMQHLLGGTKEQFKLVSFSTATGRVGRKIAKLFLPHGSACVTVLNGREYLLNINKRKLFLWDIGGATGTVGFVGFKVLCDLSHSITCIAASRTYDPASASASASASTSGSSSSSSNGNDSGSGNAMKNIVVTGHENGAILVWHDLGTWVTRQPVTIFSYDAVAKKKVMGVALPVALSAEAGQGDGKALTAADRRAFIENTPPVCTALHWHAHAVTSVAVSVDNRYMYSGGEEGVLVVWQVQAGDKVGRSFLPRLGDSIAAVSCNAVDARVVVTTNDNCVRIVNSISMKVDWELRSMYLGTHCSSSGTGAGTSRRQGLIEDATAPATGDQQQLKKRIDLTHLYDHLLSDTTTYQCGIAMEPRTNYIVSNGIPYALQFYDISSGSSANSSTSEDSASSSSSSSSSSKGKNGSKGSPAAPECVPLSAGICRGVHEVVQYQRVSKTEKFSRMYVPTVTMFAFGRYRVRRASRSGGSGRTGASSAHYEDFLATVDVRRGEEMLAETSLKVWKFDAAAGKYVLMLQVDRPHDSAKVTSLSFTPDKAAASSGSSSSGSSSSSFIGLVTAGSNGSMKMWYCNNAAAAAALSSSQRTAAASTKTANTTSSTTSGSSEWKCLYAFRYKEHPVYSLSFSRDGSLLCVTHQNLVSLWDPITVTLRGSVVVPSTNSIIFTKFIEPCYDEALGSGSGEAYLVVGTRRQLTVVDLLTMKVHWVRDGHFDSFAVASSDKEAMDLAALGVAAAPSATNAPQQRPQVGWIAAACYEDSSAAASSSGVKPRGSTHVTLFDPLSSTELYRSPSMQSSIPSMTFFVNSAAAASASTSGRRVLTHGVLCVTSTGEIKYVGESSAPPAALTGAPTEGPDSTGVFLATTHHSGVGPKLLPRDLLVESDAASGSDMLSGSQLLSAADVATSKPSSSAWYSTLISATSATSSGAGSAGAGASAIGDVYHDFLRHMRSQSANRVSSSNGEQETAAAAPTSGADSLDDLEASLFSSLTGASSSSAATAAGQTGKRSRSNSSYMSDSDNEDEAEVAADENVSSNVSVGVDAEVGRVPEASFLGKQAQMQFAASLSNCLLLSKGNNSSGATPAKAATKSNGAHTPASAAATATQSTPAAKVAKTPKGTASKSAKKQKVLEQ